MNIPPYKVHNKQLPANFPCQFDAHIYFKLKDLNLAVDLRAKAIERFRDEEVFVGEVIGEAIGPRTQAAI